jgi:hypothetical protein
MISERVLVVNDDCAVLSHGSFRTRRRTDSVVMLTDACKYRKDWQFVVIRSR